MSKKWIKFSGLFLLFSILMILITALTLPMIISTTWGQGQFMRFVNSRIPGTLTVEAFHVEWLDSQKLSGIQLKDSQGQVLLTMDSLEIEDSLLKILRIGIPLLKSQIKGLNAKIVWDSRGHTNLQKALGIKQKTALTLVPASTELKNVNVVLSPSEGITPITLKAHGMTSYEGQNGFFQVEGQLNPDSEFVNVTSHLQQVPAGLLCEIICAEKFSIRNKIEALLGPVIDADVQVNLQKFNGHIQVLVKGRNGFAELEGQINNGYLTLSKPLKAEVTATPELGSYVLGPILPILSGMVKADDRLRVTIDPNGFVLPFLDLDFNKVQLGLMTVELGKVYFNNAGQLSKIMSSFHANTREILSVWFTPIYLSMQNGYIDIQRFDMLAMQRYPVSAWGFVDIPGDKIKMSIGLSGKSLQRAVGIPAPDPHYMMQFPLEGRIGKAKLNKTMLAAKIAALTAQFAGGPQGLILGTFIGFASGYKEEKIPEPTTQPFPWASENSENDTPDQKQESSRLKPKEMIKKTAAAIIQNFLK